MMRILIILLFNPIVLGQEAERPHIEASLVVTGQFKPVTLMSSVVAVKVIDRATIESRGATDLRELLSKELQLDLEHHSVFGTSLRVGGISGENLKLLVDGVPIIGRLDGILDLEQISLAQIDRVEMIQGPMSVFYGTDAMAGVINLITRAPGSKRVAGEAQLDWRDFGDRRLDVAADLNWASDALRLSAGVRNFSGQDEDASSRNLAWPERTQANYSLQYRHHFAALVARYRLAFADEALMERAMPNMSLYWDHDYATRRLDHQLSLSGAMSESLYLDVQLGLQTYDRTRDDIALSAGLSTGSVVRDPQFDTSFESRSAKALLSYEVLAKSEFQMGFQWSDDRGSGGRLSEDLAPLAEKALILGYKWSGPMGIDLQPALRMADHNRYDIPILPSINLHQHNGFIDWRAGYSKGFRGPSMKQLYLDFSMFAGPSFYHITGNPDLDPERGEAYNLSFDKQLSSEILSLEGTLFYTQTHNLIELSASIPDPVLPNRFSREYINISKQESQGGSLRLNWVKPTYQIHLGMGRNLYFNYLSNTGDLPNYNRSWDAQLEAALSLNRQITFNLNYAYNGARPGYVSIGRPARIEEIRLDDWHDLDLMAQWHTPLKGLNLSLGIRNLFDVTEQNATYATTGTAHASTQLDWGRSYQVTIQYR